MLVELGVMQRRYHAVMKVVSGAPVAEVARSYVARSYRVSRQSVARVQVPDFCQPQV